MRDEAYYSWADVDNRLRRGLNNQERADFLRDVFDQFSDDPDLGRVEYYSLAKSLIGSEQYETAILPIKKYLQFDTRPDYSLFPCANDCLRGNWINEIDERIAILFWLAKSRHNLFRQASEEEQEERRAELVQALQRSVDDVGVVNFNGTQVIEMLHELGERPEYPSRSILVWGGDTEAQFAYSQTFAVDDFTVHSVQTKHVTPALLAPYRAVVLVRTGYKPYTPSDILALRSYVATGGSLLVVVSPGWEPAAPSMHNSLLSFFDASVDQTAITRAHSTEIIEHPITAGLTKAMAKCAVGINVPKSASLIEADDKTILAAMPYQMGRVVIASFGQWFMPNPESLGMRTKPKPRSDHWTRSVDRNDLPIELGPNRHLDLLRNTIAWLTDDNEHDENFVRQRQQLQEALHSALLVYSRVEGWETMRPALKKLVAGSPPGIWREEMLWAAGECEQQMYYHAPVSGISHGSYTFPGNSKKLFDADEEYYRELVTQFPHSPLRSFAQWRLGECERRAQIHAFVRKSSGPYFITTENDPQSVIDVFQQVDAKPASYAWAWTKIRIGMMLVKAGRIEEAAEYFESVAEAVPPGPEKKIALMSQAQCLSFLNRPAEAKRCKDAIQATPDIYWFPESTYTAWFAHKINGSSIRGVY